MRRPLYCYLLLVCVVLLASLSAASIRVDDSDGDSVTIDGGIIIAFPDPHVGSFHLAYLYPSKDAITADTTIDDITATLAALVDNVVPASVFIAYTNASYTQQLQGDSVLGGATRLYIGVVHPDLTVVEGLSLLKERRLLQLVRRIDTSVVNVVHRGQKRLLVAAVKVEKLADDAAAQTALVELLEARIFNSGTTAQEAEDAVAAAAIAVNAQESLTSDLQNDVAEVQRLLTRILRDVAEVGAVVDQAEAKLHRRHAHRDDEAAVEQTELDEATVVVRALTEVLELGVKAVAQAQDILQGGEAAVVLRQAVDDAVEAAKCAVDDAQRASSTPSLQLTQLDSGVQQAQATVEAESSTGSIEAGEQVEGTLEADSSTGNSGGGQQQVELTAELQSSTGSLGAGQEVEG